MDFYPVARDAYTVSQAGQLLCKSHASCNRPSASRNSRWIGPARGFSGAMPAFEGWPCAISAGGIFQRNAFGFLSARARAVVFGAAGFGFEQSSTFEGYFLFHHFFSQPLTGGRSIWCQMACASSFCAERDLDLSVSYVFRTSGKYPSRIREEVAGQSEGGECDLAIIFTFALRCRAPCRQF